MADPQGLDVGNMLVREQTSFDAHSQPIQNTVVTFTVGDHGPFTLVYPPGALDPARVKADIADRVKQLRALLNPGMI